MLLLKSTSHAFRISDAIDRRRLPSCDPGATPVRPSATHVRPTFRWTKTRPLVEEGHMAPSGEAHRRRLPGTFAATFTATFAGTFTGVSGYHWT